MHSDKQRALLNEPLGKGHIMCVCVCVCVCLALFQSAEGLTVTKTLGGVGWGGVGGTSGVPSLVTMAQTQMGRAWCVCV